MATGMMDTQNQPPLLVINKANENANLPYLHPHPTLLPPTLITSQTALPFVDSFSVGSCCLQSDIPNFTCETLAKVGTRGWW